MGLRKYMEQLTAESAAKLAVSDAARARAAHVLPSQRDAELASAAKRVASIQRELAAEVAFVEALQEVPDDQVAYNLAYGEARKRFGYVPAVEHFQDGGCRIWYKDWHYSDGATTGSLSAQGFSPLDALHRLLGRAKSYEHVAKGDWYGCPYCDARDSGLF